MLDSIPVGVQVFFFVVPRSLIKHQLYTSDIDIQSCSVKLFFAKFEVEKRRKV